MPFGHICMYTFTYICMHAIWTHMYTFTYICYLHTYSHLYIRSWSARNQSKNYLKSNLDFNFAAHKQTKKALSISANFVGWLFIRLPPPPFYLAHSTHKPPPSPASPFRHTPPAHSVERIITKFVIKLWQTKKFLEVADAVVDVVVFVSGFMQKLVKNQEEVDSSGAAACTNKPS